MGPQYANSITTRLRNALNAPPPVHYHTIAIGVLGCVYQENLDSLKALGLTHQHSLRTLNSLHHHSITSLSSIIATRHRLSINASKEGSIIHCRTHPPHNNTST